MGPKIEEKSFRPSCSLFKIGSKKSREQIELYFTKTWTGVVKYDSINYRNDYFILFMVEPWKITPMPDDGSERVNNYNKSF